MMEALVEADGCFEAAFVEGWFEAIENGDLDIIRDIWNRRLALAKSAIVAGLTIRAGTAGGLDGN